MPSKPSVRVYTSTFQWVAEVDVYDSFRFVESYYGIGSFEWKIPVEAIEDISILAEDNHVEFMGDKYLFGYIDYFTVTVDDSGREYYSIQGFPKKGFAKERITVPATGQDVNRFKGTPDQQIIHYLDDYLVNTINPLDSVPTIGLVPPSGIGTESTFESRNKVLSDEIETIATSNEFGWRGYMDYQLMKYMIESYRGVDRSRDQEVYPKVIFTREYDNVKDSEYVRSNLEYKNVGIVAGEGEGSDRTIVTVGDITAVGINRRVTFIDARDIQSESGTDEDEELTPEEIQEQLSQRGTEKLAEMPKIETFKVTPSDIFSTELSTLKYREDFDLGDIVSCESKKLNAYINDRLTQTEHSIDSSGNYELVFTIGTNEPSLVKKIKKEISKGQSTAETLPNSEIKEGSNNANTAIITAGEAQKIAQQAAVDAGKAVDANADTLRIANDANTTASAANNSAAVANEVANWSYLTAKNRNRRRHLIVATAGQTIVDLPFSYVVGKNQLDVYVERAKMISGTPSSELPAGFIADYTETSITRLTFTSPLQAGNRVEIIIPNRDGDEKVE
jgi:Siphovirus ReqiPepy6 Gp37-like protein